MNAEDLSVKKSGRGRGTRSGGARGAATRSNAARGAGAKSTGTRGTGRGRGRGRGRGKKAAINIDEEVSQEQVEEIPDDTGITSPIVIEDNDEPSSCNKENEVETSEKLSITAAASELYDTDISQLEPLSFTARIKQPTGQMVKLKWDHKVSLVGVKVSNPMIDCCDQCNEPILVYGRMIPCKHVFCLDCAKKEPIKNCPRCNDKIARIEEFPLGKVFMCTHGGSRYGSTGCRRTYLSQRDLQAHINHRHITQQLQPFNTESSLMKIAHMMDTSAAIKGLSMQQQQPRKSTDGVTISPVNTPGAKSAVMVRGQQQQRQQFSRNSSTGLALPISQTAGRTGLISHSMQDVQQGIGKGGVLHQQQQQQNLSNPISQSLQSHPMSTNVASAAYYSSALQSYQSSVGGNSSSLAGVVPTQSVIHNMPLVTQSQLSSRPPPSAVPPPPTPPPASSAYFNAFGQQFGQMPPYQFDQNAANSQWNQQYYR